MALVQDLDAYERMTSDPGGLLGYFTPIMDGTPWTWVFFFFLAWGVVSGLALSRGAGRRLLAVGVFSPVVAALLVLLAPPYGDGMARDILDYAALPAVISFVVAYVSSRRTLGY